MMGSSWWGGGKGIASHSARAMRLAVQAPDGHHHEIAGCRPVLFRDGALQSGVDLAVRISRLAFAELVVPLVARLKGPIDTALRDGDRAPAGIDEVILNGGATRTAAVRDFVRD
jgi:Hsp70 protein